MIPAVVKHLNTLLLSALLVACLAGSVSAQEDQSTPEIHIPDPVSVFCGATSKSVYQSVVRLAELPPIHIYDSAASPLPAGGGSKLDHPVALVSYEEDTEKPKAKDQSTPVPAGASWMGDPIFAFGGLFPMNAQAIDIWKLSRVKDSLDELAEQFEESDDVPEESQQALERAIVWHQNGRENLDQIVKLRIKTAKLPEQMQQLQEAMSQPLPEPPEQLDDEVTVESHEALLQEHRSHEERLRNEFQTSEMRIEERTRQVDGLSKREQQLEVQLSEAQSNLESQSGSDLTSRATIVENQAKIVAAKIHQRLITVESQWLASSEKRTFLQRDWLKRQLDHAQATSQRFANLVAQRRDELIKAEAARARQEAMDAHPLLRDLAEEIANLAEQRTRISKTNRSNVAEQQKLDLQLEEVDASRKKLDEHLTAAGHSRAVGLLLRVERTKLPPTSHSQQRIFEIESTLPDLKLKQLKINEQLDQLPKHRAEIEHSVTKMGPDKSIGSELMTKAETLLVKKQDYLYDLKTEYETWLNGLATLQHSHERLVENTNELRTYIDQHVLWIRSAEPLDSSDFRESVQAIQSIGTSDQWQSMVNFLSTRLNGRWFLISILALGLWLGIGMRKQLDRRLRNVCLRRSEFRVSTLVRALLLTLFQASLLPALVATLGWLLTSPFETGTIKVSISGGLLMITPQLFIASFVYRLTIRGGLAETQLGWTRAVCDLIRGATGTITRYCLPLMAITYGLEIYEDARWIDSLGRLSFIAAMAVLSWASFRLLRGIGHAWRTDPQSSRNIWEQTFALWSPLVVIGPVALACVSALGYMYSSVFLGTRLLMTWWLILGVVAAFYLTSRLIDIGHNIIVARLRWRANVEHDPASNTGGNQTAEHEINNIRLQVTRLLHVTSIVFCLVVAYSYWHDVVPAVKAFDYGLWQVNRTGESIGPNDTVIAVSKLTWITVGDILRFLMVMTATFVLSRNLPGLLRMVILDRLPLDRGGKYAISIVCRYLVAAIGLVIACRTIGFTWTSVQWLVAAMSVGLGFGLQEIFANFVAGIIILLERPIRVGDFVTVNGTTGFVTKIQLRATMIIDYDRRELIVPNKKFITDDVINWTLSDSITRVVIPVGIAYGSDTRLAQSVLLRVARDQSEVLRDPKPEVIFAKFGGSSLDFELRVHIPNREEYAGILHKLHMAIDQEFRKQGIEIAFPQQDVNVKGIEPLIQLADGTGRKKAA